MWPLTEIRERLNASARKGGAREGGYAAADLVRRTVRAGAVELPILNLAGLWALRALAPEGGDDAENLLKTIWVLRNQHTDRILNVAAEPPTAAELAALGRAIDLSTLADYVAALEEMLALIAKKKSAGPAPATRE